MGQLRTKLIDFCDQPFLDVTGPIDDKHCISQKPGQAFEAVVPVGRIGRRSR
jgi:hypothetical protein